MLTTTGIMSTGHTSVVTTVALAAHRSISKRILNDIELVFMPKQERKFICPNPGYATPDKEQNRKDNFQ